MIIALDIGNTRAKARAELGEVAVFSADPSGSRALNVWLAQYSGAQLGICAVANWANAAWANWPSEAVLEIDGHTPGALKMGYDTPSSLGPDRWAAVNGAFTENPKAPGLVIDLGTAITYDYFTPTPPTYQGGGIAPGMSMRYRALHEFTNRLPWVKPGTELPPLVGKTTEGALRAGVEHGLAAELTATVAAYQALAPSLPLNVWLTGGDAARFAPALKKTPTFVRPHLVLDGIRALLELPVRA